MVWLFLQQHVFPSYRGTEVRFLHVAPENCIQVRIEERFCGEYILGDLEPAHISPAKKATTVQIDLTALPFENQSLDLIYCSHVLEHIDDDYLAMREMHRVLKDDGCAIILVPQIQAMRQTYEDPGIKDPQLQAKLYGQPGHVRRYGIDFVDRLGSVGFLARGVLPEEFVAETDILAMGLRMGRNSERIFVCRRTERCPVELPAALC